MSAEETEQGADHAWHLSFEDEFGEEELEEDGSWFDVSDLAETLSEYFRAHPGEAENYLDEYKEYKTKSKENGAGFGFLRVRKSTEEE